MSSPAPEPGVAGGEGRRGRLLPVGRRVIQGDPSAVLAPPWSRAVIWLVLVLAAGVDVVTFHQVLVLVLTELGDAEVGVAVIGFTAVTLALAHRIGESLRDALRPGTVTGAAPSGFLCLGVWLALGAFAFLVRLLVSAGGQQTALIRVGGAVVDNDGQTTTRILGALLFLGLYLGTGVVSALAGYTRPNPAARRFGRAQRRRAREARGHAVVRADLVRATQLRVAVSRERERRERAWAEAQKECDTAAARLKHEAALLLRARGRAPGDPRAESPTVVLPVVRRFDGQGTRDDPRGRRDRR